jgi:DNA ligase-1
MPDIRPMLAQTWPTAFDDKDWLFELKWDGYRCLLYIGGSQAFLRSRNGRPLNQRFPGLVSIVKCVRGHNFRNLIADGEIVAFKDGRPDFSFLRANPDCAVYVAFDLLYFNDQPLFTVPLVDRRHKLSQVFTLNGLVYLSEAQEEMGRDLFEFAKGWDLEGIMAKRKHSLYFPGKRSRDWLKIKNLKEEDLWVVGYYPSPGRKIGSLLVAKEGAAPGLDSGDGPRRRNFVLMGRVSSGLDQSTEKTLTAAFGDPAPDKAVHFEGKLGEGELREVRWIEPFFGVRVQYTEITPEGRLRHPVLKEVIW